MDRVDSGSAIKGREGGTESEHKMKKSLGERENL